MQTDNLMERETGQGPVYTIKLPRFKCYGCGRVCKNRQGLSHHQHFCKDWNSGIRIGPGWDPMKDSAEARVSVHIEDVGRTDSDQPLILNYTVRPSDGLGRIEPSVDDTLARVKAGTDEAMAISKARRSEGADP